MIFATILIILYLIFLFLHFLFPVFGFAPFYPTKKSDIESIKNLINISPKDKVLDIGCGNGRVLKYFCKFTPFVYGVEINPFWAILAKLNLSRCGKWKGKIYTANYKNVDLENYDIIFCYLLPKDMRYLEKYKFTDLKKGSKIITNTFKLKNMRLIKKFDKLYLYKKI